ncbi:hypothetical protein Aperf_G00000007969 [Anoplocephala perfoliata]
MSLLSERIVEKLKDGKRIPNNMDCQTGVYVNEIKYHFIKSIPACYECDKLHMDPCPTHPILWIKYQKPLECDVAESGNLNDCCCGRDERKHSRRTAPEQFVRIRRSGIRGAALGVWAENDIPNGAIMGPHTGEIVPLENLSEDELKKTMQNGLGISNLVDVIYRNCL